MGMVALLSLKPFSKASQEEGFGQIKGQRGKAQEVKGWGMRPRAQHGARETEARVRPAQVLSTGPGLGSLTSRLSSRKAGEVQLKRSGSSQPWSSSHSRTAAPRGR